MYFVDFLRDLSLFKIIACCDGVRYNIYIYGVSKLRGIRKIKIYRVSRAMKCPKSALLSSMINKITNSYFYFQRLNSLLRNERNNNESSLACCNKC